MKRKLVDSTETVHVLFLIVATLFGIGMAARLAMHEPFHAPPNATSNERILR